jgi:flavoprotein
MAAPAGPRSATTPRRHPSARSRTAFPRRSLRQLARHSQPSTPSRSGRIPSRKAIIVAPATYNTLCKLALGIADTFALTVLAESIATPTPVVILPFVNTSLAARTPFTRAIDALRAKGAHILGPPGWTPHPPGTGTHHLTSFPWTTALDAAESAANTATTTRPTTPT